jgi:hypothetical protein
METLPPQSATTIKASGTPVMLEDTLLAAIADRIAAIGYGLGGKKMPVKEQLAPILTGDGMKKAARKQATHDDIIAGLRAMKAANIARGK